MSWDEWDDEPRWNEEVYGCRLFDAIATTLVALFIGAHCAVFLWAASSGWDNMAICVASWLGGQAIMGWLDRRFEGGEAAGGEGR